MKITVELNGQLLPGSPRSQVLPVNQPATVRDVAKMLNLKADEIGLVVINGVQSELNDELPPGCRLCFFPFLSGG